MSEPSVGGGPTASGSAPGPSAAASPYAPSQPGDPLPPSPPDALAGSGRRPDRSPSAMHPRTAVLLVSSFAAVLLVAVAMLLPTPYVVLKPGPSLNTLGEVGGQPLISITGRRTYPTSGELDLTTVRLLGGPGSRVNVLQVLSGWLDSSQSVVPVESIFPPDQTAEESQQLNQAEMVTSQESATAAALKALDIPVPTTLTVDGFSEGAPSAAVLRRGDVVLAVNGVRTGDLTTLQEELAKVTAGQRAPVLVRRGGQERTLQVPTASNGQRTVLGVLIDPTFRFPFDVKIQIENIGGPSAGTMFALGIIDKLTPGELTGGERIAGTGTIDADGTVGPIGGIQQKLVGARSTGARWFLAPADEGPAVVGHVPDGLTVVPVRTLDDALSAVRSIAAAGESTPQLPSC